MKIHMKCQLCGQENPSEARFCSNCGTTLALKVEPVSPLAPSTPDKKPVVTIQYAGFWIRFAAAFIDYMIVNAVVGVIRMLTIIPIMFIGRLGYSFSSIPVMSTLIESLFPILIYLWLFTGLKGKTIGKMAMGIKVIDAQGNKPDLGCAALREIVGRLVSTIALFIGFFWMAGDKEKQGWHDKIAGTHVIKSR